MSNHILAHYAEYFGEPVKVAPFGPLEFGMRLAVWPPQGHTENTLVYASVGSSELPWNGPATSLRAEYFLTLLPAVGAAVYPLGTVALAPAQSGRVPHDGLVVRYGRPLWPGTNMSSAAVVRPIEDIIPVLKRPGKPDVVFLQLIPLHNNELFFQQQHGITELKRAWAHMRVELWDPFRPPANLE